MVHPTERGRKVDTRSATGRTKACQRTTRTAENTRASVETAKEQTRNNETARMIIADGYIDDNVSVVRRTYVVHETLEYAVTSTI